MATIIRRTLIAAVLLAVGGALGASMIFVLLLNRTGTSVINKLQRAVATPASGSEPTGEGWASGSTWPVSIEPHATGFTFPVRVVFTPPDVAERTGIHYYVNELGGAIKAVTPDGTVSTVIDGLLNFERSTLEEAGLSGLEVAPDGSRLWATMAYWSDSDGTYVNKVEELVLTDDGRQVSSRRVLLDMAPESTVPSYQIQFVRLGADGALYVGVGGGGDKRMALDLDAWAGKILRMSPEGEALSDNPFFAPDAPDRPRSYVYAYGFRNPFDMAYLPSADGMVVSDVGPGIDRIVRVEPGVNYGFGDHDDQMRMNALYTWGPPPPDARIGFSPVGLEVVPGDMLASEEPYLLLCNLFGQVYHPGPTLAKRMVGFGYRPSGHLESAPEDVVIYRGQWFQTPLDVARGPDGIYFSDLYGEGEAPHQGTGTIWRVTPTDAAQARIFEEGSDLTGLARARWVWKQNRCDGCHVIDGEGHTVAMALTDYGPFVRGKVLSRDFETQMEALLAREERFFVERRDVYRDLLDRRGEDRVRAWLRRKIVDPRFDDPNVKMPTYTHLADEDVDSLVELLLD